MFTITEIPRAEAVATQIRNRYHDLSELWNSAPDALIVTGTEPVQAQLQYEPYWPYLARLLEWASFTVPSALLSCLAAHASVLLFDGIERVPHERKCSGVFSGDVDTTLPLAAGLPPVVSVPHSRVNGVPTNRMTDAGYSIVIGDGNAGIGWSVATRRCENSDFVLCQGHPEYSTYSLLREYRRDVRRSLFGRGAVPYPTPPTVTSARRGSTRRDASSTGRCAVKPTRSSSSLSSRMKRSPLTSRTHGRRRPLSCMRIGWRRCAEPIRRGPDAACVTRRSPFTAATRPTAPAPLRYRSTSDRARVRRR